MEYRKKLEEEFLEVISNHSAAIPFPVFLAALLMAVSASISPDLTYLPFIWLLAVFFVLLVRWFFLRDILTSKYVSKENRMTLVIRLSLLNGLVHASAISFFDQLDSPERAVQTLLLLGVSVGAVATTSGHRQIFSAFAFPVFISLFLSWGLFGVDKTVEDTFEKQFYRYAIPFFLLLFLMVLLSLAKNYRKMFTESFNMRSQEEKTNAKLKGLNTQLTQALEETTEANASKTRFLAAASHDLRQPIHTLTFSSTALSLQNLDDESRRISRNMDKAIQALSKQMDSLLDISKLDAGVVELEPEVFSLHDFLNQLHINNLPQMQDKHVEFTLDLPVVMENLDIETDYVQFSRIVNNLLNNALKHTEEGQISIELKKVGGKALLSIIDTGEGISEDDQKKIFDEFFQVKNPQRSSKEGLGLGLSIVKRLIKLLDMPFQLQSVLGEGTKVTLEIPLINGNNEGGEEQEFPSSDARINILCVDDDEQILEALRTVFEAIGYGVYLASGTDAAMGVIEYHTPDILLADLRLEGEDSGFETVRSVREVLPNLPAFLITGNIDPQSLRAAREAGVEMLHKPLEPKILLQKIQVALGA
ncbi:MAG: Unknown protein [uncultured Thiotrichaceae bacterium]|uniref:histidine kinase n=1 Tax=uncultured Thiotrichaceae bacterium TaxID=298394 RepID=A0A6S6TX90_9GAMM|nr:MAG: Unknown protein [uncultured Thiotrichaceae bacterium]